MICRESIVEEVKEAAKKQRTRWYNQPDLELPGKAVHRKAKAEAKTEHK